MSNLYGSDLLSERNSGFFSVQVGRNTKGILYLYTNHSLSIGYFRYLRLVFSQGWWSSSARGHDEVAASAGEDMCLPLASSWPKCRHLVGGKFVPAPLAGKGRSRSQ